MVTSNTIVLCADDYGLTAGVSNAIVELVASERLSATSCMTGSPAWPETARALRQFDGRIDIGLHLTLTDQPPVGKAPHLAPQGRLPPLARLWRQLWLDPEARREAATQLRCQLDEFQALLGRPPNFIDGHQHVHLLPGARDAVIAMAGEIARHRPIYVRSCVEPVGWIIRRRLAVPKALFLAQLSRPLHRLATMAGIPTNDSFRGVSGFAAGDKFRHEFRRFLTGPGDRPLVMCHPGYADAELRAIETLTDQRDHEFAYLRSAAFLRDLEEAGVRLGRFAA